MTPQKEVEEHSFVSSDVKKQIHVQNNYCNKTAFIDFWLSGNGEDNTCFSSQPQQITTSNKYPSAVS
jgi:hypothetical protein